MTDDTPEIQPSSIDRQLDAIERRLDAILAEQRLMLAEWRNQNQGLMEFHRDMMRLFTRLDGKLDHIEKRRGLIDAPTASTTPHRPGG